MAKTKSEKIADIEIQIAQLENRQKKLIQEQKLQERKDRTKRLCKRMGFFHASVHRQMNFGLMSILWTKKVELFYATPNASSSFCCGVI